LPIPSRTSPPGLSAHAGRLHPDRHVSAQGQTTSARQVGAGEVPAPLLWVPSPVLAPCVAGRAPDFLRADAGRPIPRPRGRTRLARRAARAPPARRALPLAPATRQPPRPCSACAGATGRPAQALNTS